MVLLFRFRVMETIGMSSLPIAIFKLPEFCQLAFGSHTAHADLVTALCARPLSGQGDGGAPSWSPAARIACAVWMMRWLLSSLSSSCWSQDWKNRDTKLSVS